jgi:hypothetical protein
MPSNAVKDSPEASVEACPECFKKYFPSCKRRVSFLARKGITCWTFFLKEFLSFSVKIKNVGIHSCRNSL